jgi:hypothetical protein
VVNINTTVAAGSFLLNTIQVITRGCMHASCEARCEAKGSSVGGLHWSYTAYFAKGAACVL